MSHPKKIVMGQPLYNRDGQPMHRSALGHNETVNMMTAQINSLHLGSDINTQITKGLEKIGVTPLGLGEAICSALDAPKINPQTGQPITLDFAEKQKRGRYITKCYRPGKAKIEDDDITYLMPIVAEFYTSSSLVVQIEALLRGNSFKAGIAEGSEDPEDDKTEKPVAIPVDGDRP